ncbi:MAG: L-lactate permease [Deinococcota bacterium]
MTLTSSLAAGSPIVVILVLMLGLGWSAAKAGATGLVLAVALALSVFSLGTDIYPTLGIPTSFLGVGAEAGFTTLTILWVILPALAIYQLQLRTGGLTTLRRVMARVSSDPRILTFLVAWFFALFIEGAAGFGTSAALAAPFLVSAGFSKVDAVAIVLVGHAVGVSFAAVGTPMLPQFAATGLDTLALSEATARYQAVLGSLIAFAIMYLVSRARSMQPFPKLWLWTLIASACFFVPFYLLARFIGPELPTLAGSLVGAISFVVLWLRFGDKTLEATSSKIASPKPESDTSSEPALTPANILKAAAPYLVLVALVLVTRLIAPVSSSLRAVVLEWSLAETFSGNIALLYHPGTLLAVSFSLGAVWQGASKQDVRSALTAASQQLIGVAIALLVMLSLSRLMVHATMISTLATSAATTLGSIWPLLAPFVGILGTFVTGSATASNILFSDFQFATANDLGLSPLTILGVQGFGAAVGNMICPHNIIAASATVALTGEEGAVLRRTLGICLGYTLLGGLMAWGLSIL